MIVDKHPTLMVDSKSLCYNIIFGVNFLNKCRITLDYENNLVQWMEYTIPLRDALEFFPIAITPLYSHHLNLMLNTIFLAPLC